MLAWLTNFFRLVWTFFQRTGGKWTRWGEPKAIRMRQRAEVVLPEESDAGPEHLKPDCSLTDVEAIELRDTRRNIGRSFHGVHLSVEEVGDDALERT